MACAYPSHWSRPCGSARYGYGGRGDEGRGDEGRGDGVRPIGGARCGQTQGQWRVDVSGLVRRDDADAGHSP